MEPSRDIIADSGSSLSRARHVSVAVRLPAVPDAEENCIGALRAVEGVAIRRLEEVASVRDLDLILDLTCLPVEPSHIVGPRHGYWTLLYGEQPERIAPGVLEILAGQRAAFVRLARLLPGDRAVILREGSVKTVAHSPARTRRRLLDAASHWPCERLRRIERGGVAPEGPEIRLPVRTRAARFGLRARLPLAVLRNLLRRVRQELTRERWRIGVIAQPIDRLLAGFDPAAIQWLDVPFEGFLADPFGLARGGEPVILAEAFAWNERRGRIAAIERQREGSLGCTRTSLSFEAHLSYPQLIEYGGEIYCLPECSERNRVQLFRAVDFPARWAPDAVLLEGFAGADATVIRYRDRWWMFTCNHADQDEAKLFIFHASRLHGPWTAHASNPVKCDLRSSRPAGTPFVAADGALYRPAQDCSQVYGGAVVINRITRLTPDEFEEEIATRLRPDPRGPCPDGMHTVSAVGDLTLVDGKRHELVPLPLAAALKWLKGRGARALAEHGQDCFHQSAS